MNFSFRSVRIRLLLWNVGILALVLVILGTASRYQLAYTGTAEVDRTLAGAAHAMREMEDRPPPPPPENRDPSEDQGQRPPRRDAPQAGRRFAPRHRFGSGGGPLSAFHPIFLDLNKNPLFSPPDAPARPSVPWDADGFAQAAAGREVYSTLQSGPEPLRVLSVPIRRGGKMIGVAQLTSSLAPLNEEIKRLTRTLLTLIPLALLIAGLGGAFLSDRALRPVRALGAAAGRIEASDLSRRLPAGGGDEFAALAQTFNGMLSRLEQAFRALETAYEQQRRFTADASHELRTPLTIIKANTSLALLGGGGTAADYRCALEAADLGADRTIRLVQDLLLLSRADAGQEPMRREIVSLPTLLTEAADAVQPADRRPQATLEFTLPDDDLPLRGDEDALRRLFTNLLENALRHTPPPGTVTVSARRSDSTIVVSIADTGEGIAAEHLPRLFDRFYRADAARSGATGGTGLGLAICRSITAAHGGQIRLESVPGSGTTVVVTLPLAV